MKLLPVPTTLKDGYDDLVNDLVEVFLLDTAETTLNITLDIARENLTLYEAGLRKEETHLDDVSLMVLHR